MLRCRMHMRVSAEPMSLVAPGGERNAVDEGQGTPPHQSQPSLYTGTRLARGGDDQHWGALGFGDTLGRGWFAFSPNKSTK